MQDIKLIHLLKKLTPREIKRLKRFLVLSNHKKHLALYELILKYRKVNFKSKYLNKEVVYPKIFNGEKYNTTSNKWTNLTSTFAKVVEDFLVFSDVIDDQKTIKKDYLVLEALRKRSLDKEYIELFAKDVYKKLSNKYSHSYENIDDEYYYQSYLIKVRLNSHGFVEPNHKKKFEEFDESIKDYKTDFEAYIALNELCYSCAILNASQVEKISVHPEMISAEKLLSKYAGSPVLNLTLVRLCYQTLQLLLNKEDCFGELRKTLAQLKEPISKVSLEFIYTILVNHCIQKMRQGEKGMIVEKLSIYREMLRKEVILKDKEINPRLIKNIVTAFAKDIVEDNKKKKKEEIEGMTKNVVIPFEKNIIENDKETKREEIEGVIKFVEECKDKVKEELRDRVFNFNMAVFCFYLEEFGEMEPYLDRIYKYINEERKPKRQYYGEVTDFINQVEKSDHIDNYYTIECEILRFKVWYETENDKLIEDYEDRRTLKRIAYQKLFPDNIIISYQNFIRFASRLYRYRQEPNKKVSTLERLIHEIQNAEFISNKEWLERKLKEVQNKQEK